MKRLLTDCIPEDALYRLTEEAFEQAPAGEKKAGRTAPRILALAASLAIVVTALRFHPVFCHLPLPQGGYPGYWGEKGIRSCPDRKQKGWGGHQPL